MRALVLTASMVSIGSLLCGSAWASSIQDITPSGRTHSIVTKTCRTCDQAEMSHPKAKDGPGVYQVPALGEDIQKTEIKTINGEEKIVRTEAWLGGSPVTFVSKVPAGMSPQQKAEATEPVINGPVNTTRVVEKPAQDGIDTTPTAAVDGNNAAPQNFDGYSLRVK